MLTKEDLQAIRLLMKEEISESEQRTKTELKAYIENTAAKDVKTIAEGHMALNEKLDRILERIEVAEDFEPRVSALEMKVKENSSDIVQLKKAQ